MPVRFPLFDGLRATAALLVFVDHAWFRWHPPACGFVACTPGGDPAARLWAQIVPTLGPTGVSIFFVISGFLLYRPWVAARMSGRRLDLGSYALRRAARILPAYWAVIVITLLLGAEVRDLDLGSIVQLLTLTSVYSYEGLLYNPVPPTWSVCVELSFYLFLPFWGLACGLLAARSRRAIRLELVLLAALGLCGIVWRVLVQRHPPSGSGFHLLLGFIPSTDKILLGGLDLFAVGMVLALLSAHGRLPGVLSRCPASVWWSAALVALVGAALLTAPDGVLSGRPAWQSFASGIGRLTVAAFVVMPAVALAGAGAQSRSRDPVRRFLRLDSVVYLGVVSYAVYLWHAPLLAWVHRLVPTADGLLQWGGLAASGLVATVAVAAISWRALERPINTWAHRRSRFGGSAIGNRSRPE